MIRTAIASDADTIAKLLVRSIREICGPDYGNDESLLSVWCSNKTPENMRRGIEHSRTYWIVAEENGVIAGTAMMTKSGSVELCYLLPEYLGRGLGSAMLADLINTARTLGLAQMTLESTRTARQFYKRNGFTELGETVCMGKIPGFMMEKILNA